MNKTGAEWVGGVWGAPNSWSLMQHKWDGSLKIRWTCYKIRITLLRPECVCEGACVFISPVYLYRHSPGWENGERDGRWWINWCERESSWSVVGGCLFSQDKRMFFWCIFTFVGFPPRCGGVFHLFGPLLIPWTSPPQRLVSVFFFFRSRSVEFRFLQVFSVFFFLILF